VTAEVKETSDFVDLKHLRAWTMLDNWIEVKETSVIFDLK
jgi:hypothetical protein